MLEFRRCAIDYVIYLTFVLTSISHLHVRRLIQFNDLNMTICICLKNSVHTNLIHLLTCAFLLITLSHCNPTPPSNMPNPSESTTTATVELPKGHLFIIGGGKRPPELVQEIADLAQLAEGGYGIILPMASSEPDTAAFYAQKQFVDLGLPAEQLISYPFQKGEYPAARLDSVRRARLIYLTGGDQERLMQVILNSPLHEAIQTAYLEGAVIAGTSAGAAVMGQKMITGNEYKHPEYTGDFRTIEAENLEIKTGLGLLPNAIIDQHFVYRMRMNRLMTVAIEYPDQLCLGIDESTAVVISGDQVRVTGIGQVIKLTNPNASQRVQKGLLGGQDLQLSVHLPGDHFPLHGHFTKRQNTKE